jgi:hypothetical protein
VSPELVAARWGEIISMEGADCPATHHEAAGAVMGRIKVGASQSKGVMTGP